MNLNRQTGELAWDFGPADAGAHELSVSVRDSDNAEVILNVPLRWSREKKAVNGDARKTSAR